MNEQDLTNLIVLDDGFTAKYKCSGTATRFCQVGFGLDEDLSERSVGHLAVYVPMGGDDGGEKGKHAFGGSLMPAFVANGPDIPERLLQAHEEGRVVFFCGAGISYPARLPGFSELVKRLYEELGVSPNTIQQAAIKAGQFDTAIGLLESGIVGGREIVRRKIAEILAPDLSAPNATATHEALLTLAHNSDGHLRLITTNFDRLFEEVIASKILAIECFKTPLLPVPKKRWNGLIYLHGLLPSAPTPSELDCLVVSSGDFGLAYLTERWAARFVSELFRNYTVCFIGYSINDPVLRYMMDALAADRLLGELPPEMFAFGSHSKGKESERSDEWRAKNVTPILYREFRYHIYLHKTLRTWADTYRDGVRGKQMIIAQHATTPPLAPSRSDFGVGRVLWAVTDALAAKHFADLNPVPPLEWLEPLAEAQFKHEDLPRFGLIPETQKNDKLSFSVIQRPVPYTHAPWMCVVDMVARASDWDEVMFQLARWLTRHLDNPKLVVWLAKQGGQLHEKFVRMILNRIEYLDRLLHDGKQDDLNQILAAAPKAIPRPLMRTLWRLFLSGRVKSHVRDYGMNDWLHQFKLDGLTPTLRMKLREILTPRVTLREPFRWNEEIADSHEPERIKELVDWELVLSSDHVHSALRKLEQNAEWQRALPDLLPDFTILLRDALDLMRELGGAEDKSDSSFIAQPSISKHPQNRSFRDWTALVELMRDAWLAMVPINPAQARLSAEGWLHVPYPLFKRLAFFAAANSDVIAPRQVLDWLLADRHWWLWSVETERETFRLLMSLAPKLDVQALAEIEQAILKGPPREMFKDDIEPKKWAGIVDHEVWLRLAKVEASGASLSQPAKTKLRELCQQYPDCQITPDERDEFPFWMDGGGERREFVITPRLRSAMVKWLQQPRTDHRQDDDWPQRCRDDFPTTACALCELAKEGEWPASRWRVALQAWADGGNLLKRSWRYMAPAIVTATDTVLQVLSHSLSWWMRAQAETFEGKEELFFSLIRRILALEYEDSDQTDDLVSRADNHPVGHVTEALLRWCYRQELKDSLYIAAEVKLLFTQLCDTGVDKFRHGRILLASHAIALFRVDEKWAEKHLLPLFNWQRSEVEARAVWQGLLWSPRLYWPLLAAIKQPFLETARHYEQLGENAEQYAAFLTFAALEPGDTITAKEFSEATGSLPASGLESVAQAVTRALEGAGERRGEYWRNRVLPYLKLVWPKSRSVMTRAISKHLGELCIAAQKVFPEAMEALWHWLQPVEYPDSLVHLLNEAKLCEQFPSDTLMFLDAVIGDDAQWLPKELKQCLNDIGNADQTLANDLRFVRLTDFSERRGNS